MSRALKLWIGLAVLLGAGLCGSQVAEIPARSALRGYDNTFNYLWLRSAMVDHDWDFHNDLAAANTLVPEHRASALALPVTATGRIPNKYGIGWAVLTLPFYLLADGVVAIGREAGLWTLSRDGFNPVYQIAVQVGHYALGLVALFLAAATITRWIGNRAAAVSGVLTVWMTSSLLYYQTVNVSMSHGAAFFAASLLAYAIERTRQDQGADDSAPRARWWLLAGGAFGLAVIIRFQLALLGVVIAWALLARGPVDGAQAAKGRQLPSTPDFVPPSFRELFRRVGWVTLGVAPFVVLQLWAWRSVYGRWLVFGYGAEGESFHWSRPEIMNSLFSSWHGLFYWHPFLLVAVGGLGAWAWTRRGAVLGWGLFLIATIYINAAWWCWWFASSFGNRGYDAVLLPLMAGAAWLFHRAQGRLRTVLCTLAVTMVLWNLYLVLLYRSGAIPRQAPVTWIEMLAAAVRLPESIHF